MSSEPLEWRRRFSGTSHPLIIALSNDDAMRMQARRLADALDIYPSGLLRYNPRSVRLDDDLEPTDQTTNPDAVIETRRRHLAHAAGKIASELRGMASLAALHSEAAELTRLTSTKAEQA